MKYFVEIDYEKEVEIPKHIQKQIVLDHLQKYYITSLTLGIFIIGFLLGVIASA